MGYENGDALPRAANAPVGYPAGAGGRAPIVPLDVAAHRLPPRAAAEPPRPLHRHRRGQPERHYHSRRRAAGARPHRPLPGRDQAHPVRRRPGEPATAGGARRANDRLHRRLGAARRSSISSPSPSATATAARASARCSSSRRWIWRGRRRSPSSRWRCASPTAPRSGSTRSTGFEQAGLRPRYYSDNKEDAYILTASGLTTDDYARRLAALREEHRARYGEFNVLGSG